MDKAIIHDHFSTTAKTWRDQVYKSKNQQGVFEYFDKQYRFDTQSIFIWRLNYKVSEE